jgi:hypothetical protein
LIRLRRSTGATRLRVASKSDVLHVVHGMRHRYSITRNCRRVTGETSIELRSPSAALGRRSANRLDTGSGISWHRGPVGPRRPMGDRVSLRKQIAALWQAGQVRCRRPSETPDQEAARRLGADLRRRCYVFGRSARDPVKLRGHAPRRSAVQPGHVLAALLLGKRPGRQRGRSGRLIMG